MQRATLFITRSASITFASPLQARAPTDPQIANIAYTAGAL